MIEMGIVCGLLISLVVSAGSAGGVSMAWAGQSSCSSTSPREPSEGAVRLIRQLEPALSSGSGLPLDNLGSDLPTYSVGERLLGFSYYVGQGNGRFEKLEGYEDVYVWIDFYDPTRHPLNRLFLGSSAVIKVDRSVSPPRYTYLSREKHVGTASAEALRDAKNVNEHLCSLNKSCNQQLKAFNLIARSAEFDSQISAEYKSLLKKRFTDLLVTDIYASNPPVAEKVRAVIDRLDFVALASAAEVNQWLLRELRSVTEAKIGNLTREQYQSQVPGNDTERALDYITYKSIIANTESELEKRSHHVKKAAILEFCSKHEIPACNVPRSLKRDLDDFESRRKVLPPGQELPTS